MSNKFHSALVAGAFGAALVLAGCGTDDSGAQRPDASAAQDHQGHGASGAPSGDGHGGDSMDHPADGGPAPEGIADAVDPAFPVGTKVQLTADHMVGMDGATATIAGAFDTYTYAVTYTPAGGGDPVPDHKWVVQEEIRDAGTDRLADGTEVTLLAEHMDGMDGATATITSSTDETVYMVDYEADGMAMTNHKWVVESEIKPAS